MMSSLRMRLALPALLLAPAWALSAQTSHPHLGGRFIYDGTNEEAGLGLQFSGPIGRRFEFYPSGDYYFTDVGSRWVANMDIKYRFPAAERPMWFYVGGGFGFDNRKVGNLSDTQAGVNVFTGLEPLRGAVHPFAELRFTAADKTRIGLAFGINVTLGENR